MREAFGSALTVGYVEVEVAKPVTERARSAEPATSDQLG